MSLLIRPDGLQIRMVYNLNELNRKKREHWGDDLCAWILCVGLTYSKIASFRLFCVWMIGYLKESSYL